MNDNHQRPDTDDNHERHEPNDNHHNAKNNGFDNSYRRPTPPSPRRVGDDHNDDQKSPSPTPRHPPQRASSSTRVCIHFVYWICLTNIFIDVCLCACLLGIFVCVLICFFIA